MTYMIGIWSRSGLFAIYHEKKSNDSLDTIFSLAYYSKYLRISDWYGLHWLTLLLIMSNTLLRIIGIIRVHTSVPNIRFEKNLTANNAESRSILIARMQLSSSCLMRPKYYLDWFNFLLLKVCCIIGISRLLKNNRDLMFT